MTKERILEVIKKLPHSETRVPYTYHHDYIRQQSQKMLGSSRSEVAILAKDTSEEAIYATALVQIVLECSPFELISILDKDDVWAIMNCKAIAEAHASGDF